MEVHKRLGNGFLEAVYQEALTIEFERCGLVFERERVIEIEYRDRVLASTYRADFICFDEVVVEVKALSELVDSHFAQIINYLKATGLKRGVLLNFGAPSLEYKRLVYNFQS